jgi:hypothetical protein
MFELPLLHFSTAGWHVCLKYVIVSFYKFYYDYGVLDFK